MPYYWQNAMLLNAEHFRDILHGSYMADCRIAFSKERHLPRLDARCLPFHPVLLQSRGLFGSPVVVLSRLKPTQLSAATWHQLLAPCHMCRRLSITSVGIERCDVSQLMDVAVAAIAVATRLPPALRARYGQHMCGLARRRHGLRAPRTMSSTGTPSRLRALCCCTVMIHPWGCKTSPLAASILLYGSVHSSRQDFRKPWDCEDCRLQLDSCFLLGFLEAFELSSPSFVDFSFSSTGPVSGRRPPCKARRRPICEGSSAAGPSLWHAMVLFVFAFLPSLLKLPWFLPARFQFLPAFSTAQALLLLVDG